jgi:tetratricopeptide (TPR) repeat protein
MMGCFRPTCDVSVARTAALFFVLFLFLGGALSYSSAQNRTAAIVEIDGPLSVTAGEEALLSARVNPATSQTLDNGAFLEWLINGVPRSTKNVLRCRSKIPATYKITLNLISEATGRRVILARDQHTLTFVERPPVVAQPTPSASRASAARWILKGKRDWVDEIRVPELQTSVSLGENEYVGISSLRCVGTAESKVRWSKMPEILEPGTTLSLELQQELNLAADPDPACDPPQLPRATANAKFFVLTDARHERTIDTIAETARSKTDRFSKTKLVQWRVPSGRLRDEMTVEIGGESPAGSASRFYTYELKSVETAKTEPPPVAPAVAATPRAVSKPSPPPAPAPAATRPAPVATRPTALSVSLEAPSANLPLGATARIHASIKGGRPPYRIFSSIRGIAADEDVDTITLRLNRTGNQSVAVRVSDADGNSARDETNIAADPPAVRLIKRSPAGDRIYIEEFADFECELYSLHKAEPGDFIFRWRSDAAISFDPPEGPSAKTRTQFFTPGRNEVWVEVLYRVDESRYEAVSRSEPVELNVIPPETLITFSTPRPYVGQQVRAVASTKPPLSNVEYRWNGVPPNAIILSRSADFQEARFCLKDEAPAEFKVSALLPRVGDVAGEAAARISARRYRVEIGGPETTDVIPTVWTPGVGLEPLDGRFAEGQSMILRAIISPTPPDQALSYEWRSTSRACNIRDPASEAPVVQAGQTGSHPVTLVIRDANGIELGSAQLVLNVVVSAREIEDAQKQARANERREQGFELLRQDKLPEAMALYRESLALWPSEEVQKHLEQLERQIAQQETLQARALNLNAEADTLERQGDMEGALSRYRESFKLVSDPRVESEIARIEKHFEAQRKKQAEARALIADGQKLEDRGSLREALEVYTRSLAVWPSKELEARMATLRARIADQDARRAKAAALKVEGESLEREKKLEDAAARYRESLKIWQDTELQKKLWTLESEMTRQEQDRKQALSLKNEAKTLLDAKQYDEAIAKYRSSLQLLHDPEMEKQVQQLESALQTRRTRQANAARLREEGEKLEAAGNLKDAIERYKASLEAWTTDGVETRVQELEARLEQQDADLARANALEREGTDFERAGKIEDAIAKLTESIALRPNPALEDRVTTLRDTLRQRERDRQTSARLRREGQSLEEKGQLEAALLKYRESLRAWPDDALAEHAKSLEQQVREETSIRASVDRLREEASALLLQGQHAQAIAKLKESLALRHDPSVVAHIAKIEAEKRAQELEQEGAIFEREGRIEQAIAKFSESLDLRPNAALDARVTALRNVLLQREARKQTAEKLRREAEHLEKDGEIEAALAKFRESLQAQPDEQVAQRINDLEQNLKANAEARIAAERLRDEASVLLLQGQMEEAIAKFKESLATHPNAELERHVQNLEEEAARVASSRVNAQKTAEEASRLESTGQLKEALALYRESLTLYPEDSIREKIAQLEARGQEEENRRIRAAVLRDEAAAILLENRLEEAIAKFRESLELEPNVSLEARVRKLEDQLRKQKADLADAQRLYDEGVALEGEGKLQDAATKYRASLRLRSEPELRTRLAAIDARIREEASRRTAEAAARKTREANARKIREEGEKLQRAGRLADAASRFRASIELVPDTELEGQIASLEQQLAAEEQRKQAVTRLRDEAQALLLDKRVDEAIAKYRESLALEPDQALETHVLRLEEQSRKEKADAQTALRLKKEGTALELEGRLEDASARLRESLALRSDPQVRTQLARVEARIREHAAGRDAASAAMKARQAASQRLRVDGERLEEAGQLKEAIAKYRGSLDVWPDTDLEEHVRQLEQAAAAKDEAMAKARKLEEEGAKAEREGRTEEAIAKYRASLEEVPNTVLENRIATLRGQLTEQDNRLLQAAEFAARALDMENAEQLDDAIAAYRRSIELNPDAALQERLQKLEERRNAHQQRVTEAARLRDEAHRLLAENQRSQALERYNESLLLHPDPEVQQIATALESEIEQLTKDDSRASELAAMGRDLEHRNKWEEAANAYRNSLAIRADEEVLANLQRIEKELSALAVKRNHVTRLLEEAKTLEAQDKAAEAIARYREALSLSLDSNIEQHVVSLERAMVDRDGALTRARQLEEEGARAEGDGLLEEAIEKYVASMEASPNAVIESRLVILRNQLAEKQQRLEQAAALTANGRKLEEEGKLNEAAAAYRSSLAILPDEDVHNRLQRIEREFLARETRRVNAARLREEAHILKTQNKTTEAIARYRESLSLWPDKRLEDHVHALESHLAQELKDRELAARLRNEAEVLEREDRLEEALAKYRESLRFSPDPGTEAVVNDLQMQLARKATDMETANRLWREGISLVKTGKRSEGLVLLKQSLEFHRPSDRAGAVSDIERQVAAATAQQQMPPPAAAPVATATTKPAERAKPASRVAASSTPTQKTPEPPRPAPKATPPAPARPAITGTRWKGVILIGSGKNTLQWPLRIAIGQGNDISALYLDRDASGEAVEYSIGGVFDPPSGTLYMAVQRKTRRESMKATLIGTMKSPESAGGQVSLSLSEPHSESRKGIWRLMREP